jgi:cytochrome c-type biogenesis protein CcmE
MNRQRIVCLMLILAFLGYSLWTYKSSLTPYVTFAQAKSTAGTVQVKGVLADQRVAEEKGTLGFTLRDEAGEVVPVVYKGSKPEGFEQATSVVAIGKYRSGQFVAEKLLVKCPSKYQGSVKP